MIDSPWYKTFFGDDYLRIYEPILTPERTQRDVDGIVNLLALPQGSSILDLCCGHGRHAIPLAQRGYMVTGLDLSEVFLREAEKEALAKAVHVDFLHADMRNIPFENEFDAVINIFTAFGYLENQDEDQQVLNQVYKALKPGGLFLLEIIHREGLIPTRVPGDILEETREKRKKNCFGNESHTSCGSFSAGRSQTSHENGPTILGATTMVDHLYCLKRPTQSRRDCETYRRVCDNGAPSHFHLQPLGDCCD